MPIQSDPPNLQFESLLQSNYNLLIEVAAELHWQDTVLKPLLKHGLAQGQTILLICPEALASDLHEKLVALCPPGPIWPQVVRVPDDLTSDDPRFIWEPSLDPYVGIATVGGMFDNIFAAYRGFWSMLDKAWIPRNVLLITVGMDRCRDRREQAQFQMILTMLRKSALNKVMRLRKIMIVQPLQNRDTLAHWFDARIVPLPEAKIRYLLTSALTDREICAEMLECLITSYKGWSLDAAGDLFVDATFGIHPDAIRRTVADTVDHLEEIQRLFYTRNDAGTWVYTISTPLNRYHLRKASDADRAYFGTTWGELPTLTPFDTLVVAACAPDFTPLVTPVRGPEASVLEALMTLPSDLLKQPMAALESLLRVPADRLWQAIYAALVAWGLIQGADAATIALNAGLDVATAARLMRGFRRVLHTIIGTADGPIVVNNLRAQAMRQLVNGVSPSFVTLAMIPHMTTPMLCRLINDGYTNLPSLVAGDAYADLHHKKWKTLRKIAVQRVNLAYSIACLNDDVYEYEYCDALIKNALMLFLRGPEQDYQVGFVDSPEKSLDLLHLFTRN